MAGLGQLRRGRLVRSRRGKGDMDARVGAGEVISRPNCTNEMGRYGKSRNLLVLQGLATDHWTVEQI